MKLSRRGAIFRCNFIREIGSNCRRFHVVLIFEPLRFENICLCGRVELFKKKKLVISSRVNSKM